jgi:hypothetical protein
MLCRALARPPHTRGSGAVLCMLPPAHLSGPALQGAPAEGKNAKWS